MLTPTAEILLAILKLDFHIYTSSIQFTAGNEFKANKQFLDEKVLKYQQSQD